MNNWLILLFTLVAMQRLWELEISRRNQRWIKEQGGYEVGKEHYPIIVGIHLLFFAGILVESYFFHATPPFWWPIPFVVFIAAQGLRYWCIKTLGRYWNTRIWVIPGHPPKKTGPYRVIRHPNYLVVMVEILVFPLIFGAYITSISLSIVNTLVLVLLRVPMEELALNESGNYDLEMEDRKRFFPLWK